MQGYANLRFCYIVTVSRRFGELMTPITGLSKFSAPTFAVLVFDWLKNSDYEPIVGVLRHMENSTPKLKIFAL